MNLRKAAPIVVMSCIFLLSCGDDASVPSQGDQDAPVGTASISGRLAATTLSAARANSATAVNAISGYKIIAQALQTERIYVVTTGSDGSFEFTVPTDDSYTFHILDDDYFYVAPVIMGEFDPADEEVPEGMELDTADVDLEDVLLDESEFIAFLTTGDIVTVDSTMMAEAINGIPPGADNQGAEPSNHAGSTLDIDGDGVINIMDSDDDGDGILDEFDDDWRQECFSPVGHIGLFSNFHNILDQAGNPPEVLGDEQYILTVEFVVQSGEEGKVTEVSVDGPAYLDQFEITYSLGTAASNWENYNQKKLIKGYGEGLLVADDERWGAFLNGVDAAHVWDVVQPGDVWIFEITYTENGTEYTELMAKKINFIFEDSPRNVYIYGQRWTSIEMYGLPDTVIVNWDVIALLPGMAYTVGYIPFVNGQQYNDDSGGSCEAGIDGNSAIFVFADTTHSGDTIDMYHIDVIASDSYGDNAKTMGGFISKWPQ